MNTARLLDDPVEGWRARVLAVSSAKKSIDMEYFTFLPSQTMYAFTGLLIEAAQRGVKIRIILEGRTHQLSKAYLTYIASIENIELKYYLYPRKIEDSRTWTQGLHDKILIADRKLLITGGRNIGDVFFARSKDGKPYSLDRDILIQAKSEDGGVLGDVRKYFEKLFSSPLTSPTGTSSAPVAALQSYYDADVSIEKRKIDEFLAKERSEFPSFFSSPPKYKYAVRAVSHIQFIHDSLYDKREQTGTAPALYNALRAARFSVIGQSPYIIFTEGMQRVFGAVSKKVPFTLITNSLACSPNVMAVAGYLTDRHKLLDMGVELFEYQGPNNVHHKSFVIDEQIAIIGSFNLDPRSAHLNTEMLFIIDDVSFAKDLLHATHFHQSRSLRVLDDGSYAPGSVQAVKVSTSKKLLVSFVRLFVPFVRKFL